MNHAAIEIETVRRPAQQQKLRNATLNGTGMLSSRLENALEQKARRLKRGILIAWLAACALAVSFSLVAAAEFPQAAWRSAQARGGNCLSDCQWAGIRCSGDCSMTDASHFVCERNCASTKSKCIETCNRREGLSKAAENTESNAVCRRQPGAALCSHGRPFSLSESVLTLVAASAR
jgi:hypothetical protein